MEQTESLKQSPIYLDYAASTPLLPQVKETLNSVLDIYANPSSAHSAGIKASSVIAIAKQNIAQKINVKESEIFFTSGATFSNSQAIRGFVNRHPETYVITSSIEHDDVYLLLKDLSYDMRAIIPCDDKGKLDIDCLKETLDELEFTESTVLVSVQWANNEMGVIQDMQAISDLVNSYPNVYLHTDATQYIPYFPVDITKLKIDMLSASAQKIGGLKGTGLLYVRNGVILSPIVYGDQGLIGGTENVPGIACMGEAFKQLDYSKNKSLESKRNYLYKQLSNTGTLVGSLEDRLPNNLCMVFEGVRGEELVSLLDFNDIYVSSGSACSTHTDEPSHTLLSLGFSKELAGSSIRFSLSDDVTYQELDYVATVVKHCVDILRHK